MKFRDQKLPDRNVLLIAPCKLRLPFTSLCRGEQEKTGLQKER